MNTAGATEGSIASVGAWLWHAPTGQSARVLSIETAWGHEAVTVWLLRDGNVASVPSGELERASPADGLDAFIHRIAAARVQEALAQDVLLAPLRSIVTPLPHQLYALERAMGERRVRHLFADEVGLGKTIEAGLVIRELKLRRIAQRILVVAPKGLTPQWQAEMRLHFGETFHVADPSSMEGSNHGSDNPWTNHDQVICPLDSVKPITRRRGWSHERLAAYNQRRFEDLVTAGWDLVVVDEAHRLGGATDQVARYRLGAALADAAPNLLLLSATPHSGKTEQFLRIMRLLDGEAFPDETSLTPDRVRPFVVRTEKRLAIDNEGAPLFRPRQTRLESVDWLPRHTPHRDLYEAVSDYVRHGYNQSLKSKQRHIGFLMVLMQRLVTSSTAAITATLTRRLAALSEPNRQLALGADLDDEDLNDLDAQERLEEMIDWPGWQSEKAEVQMLLDLALRARGINDPKLDALLTIMRQIEVEEDDPDLKVLIFTEFVPTQEMLATALRDRGINVATLNGQMPLDDRIRAQEEFRSQARILVSTDAGGEGLNLQFAHVIVNFDMPWNPMRIEQRIGRVDRIGQGKTVRAFNLQLADTVEARVRDVLEQKLAAIAEELGFDKAADVLDSSETEGAFDTVYLSALAGDALDGTIDHTLENLRAKIADEKRNREMLAGHSILDPKAARDARQHPIHHWIERAVIAGVRDRGGDIQRDGERMSIRWPGETPGILTSSRSAVDHASDPDAATLSLQDERVRGLIDDVQRATTNFASVHLRVPGLPSSIAGIWALWRIGIATDSRRHRYAATFCQGARTFGPAGSRVWDELLSREDVELVATTERVEVDRDGAQPILRPVYEQLVREQDKETAAARERATTSFEARQRAIGRIGLENVRSHRRRKLEEAHANRLAQIEAIAKTLPTLELIAAAQVEAA
ncbi:helicase-related protein [Sphingomonas sp. PvP056]|uniref:DEAD/DEAH box helicase n=1 Tax=Sphingomonas sp. PvP056 TaxID=3156392 RepID=UPI003399BD6D